MKSRNVVHHRASEVIGWRALAEPALLCDLDLSRIERVTVDEESR